MKKTIVLLSLLLINGQAIASDVDTRLEGIATNLIGTLGTEDGDLYYGEICSKQRVFLNKYADLGKPAAQFSLAYCYENHYEKKTQAVKLYRKAAIQGYAKAQYLLGLAYADRRGSRGVEKDMTQAIEWYKKSAENGYAASLKNLADIYSGWSDGIERDVAQAVEWYKKFVEQGDKGDIFESNHAKFRLGEIYETGKGSVKQDKAQAIEWYRKAGETSKVEELTKTAQ